MLLFLAESVLCFGDTSCICISNSQHKHDKAGALCELEAPSSLITFSHMQINASN